MDKNEVVGKDGFRYCKVCGERTERIIKFPLADGKGGNEERIVHCTCKCDRERDEKIQARFKYEEEQRKISDLHRLSLMDEKFREAKFSTYKVTEENKKAFQIARNYVCNFKKMMEENQGLLFWGNVGTGKSYTAACIGNELMNKSYSVIMTSFVKMLESKTIADNDETAIIEKFTKASLLIIDDLGTERSTDYALEKVYNIIDSRYRTRKPIILTTNLEFAQMKECTDIRYNRIYDRIFEMCYPLKMSGISWRKREAASRYGEMKKLLEE